MQAEFSHEGQRIDYTPAGALAAGDVVVLGDIVGVTPRPLAASEAGSLIIQGVFRFAKGSGAIAQGVNLYWDDTNNVVSADPAAGRKIGPCTKAALTADTHVEASLNPNLGVQSGGVVSKAANYTVTEADNGKTFLTGAVDLVFTLPATKNGLEYTFLASTLSVTTGLSVSPAAADKIMGKGITAADNKDYVNTGSSDAVGDLITIRGDGVDGWYVVAERGTWAREA